MREFPAKFIPKNLTEFVVYKYARDICYLREAVYEWFIREKPQKDKKELAPYESPFNLEEFEKLRAPPNFTAMVKEICSELSRLGWETRIGFKNTALWVYPKDSPPKSLPEW